MKSVLLLQIENRKNELLKTLMNENAENCKKNNMKYVFLEYSSFHVPPYWAKIFEMYKYLKMYTDINYFVWLDSDAFFVHFDNQRFQDFLKTYDYYSIITSRNMPPWNISWNKKFFNAGSFIVKNDIHSHYIMKEWITKYNPNKWQYIDSKWETDSEWSGVDYEQGSFVKYILNDSLYNKRIANLPYYFLNNNNCENNINDTIVVHLAGYHKTIDITLQNCLKTLQYNMNIIEKKDISIEMEIQKDSQIVLFLFLGFLYFCSLYVFVITRKNIETRKYNI